MATTPSTTGAAGAREYLTAFFKYRTAILVTFAAVVATVAVGTLLTTPIYEAESRILVKFGRENIYRSEVGSETNQVLAFNTEEILNSEVSILTSRDLITHVVSTMTVERLYPGLVTHPPRTGTPLQAAVDTFTDALTVDAVRNSSVIEIALQHEDPDIAAAALNQLLESFTEKHLLAYSDQQSSYLQTQLDIYEQRLMESQDRLKGFKQESGVFALDEQRSLLLTQRADLHAAMNASQSRLSELRQGIAALEAQLETVAPDVPLSTENERYRSIDDARTRLLALRLSEQDLLRQYTDQNRLVVGVREEMQIVERFIQQQESDITSRMRTGQNVVYQDLQTDLFRLRAELPSQEARTTALRTQIGQLDARIPVLDQSESVLDNLKRDIAINDRNYMAYQERVEEARTLEELDRLRSANISVIQAATVPARPIKPLIAMNLAVAVMLGAMAGVAVALASELYSQALSTPESVERRLGLPVLATIVLRRQRREPQVSSLHLEGDMVRLHHQIGVLLASATGRSLQFIASRPTEGTSTIASEFARVGATHFGQRVLLLEARPPPDDGAATPVAFHPTPVPQTMLSLGTLPPALIAPSATGEPATVWDRLRREFDLIVIDSPSAATAPDWLAASGRVDGVVLVVEAETTRWPVAARTKEDVVRSGGRMLGAVLNKRRHYIPAFLYDRL